MIGQLKPTGEGFPGRIIQWAQQKLENKMHEVLQRSDPNVRIPAPRRTPSSALAREKTPAGRYLYLHMYSIKASEQHLNSAFR